MEAGVTGGFEVASLDNWVNGNATKIVLTSGDHPGGCLEGLRKMMISVLDVLTVRYPQCIHLAMSSKPTWSRSSRR